MAKRELEKPEIQPVVTGKVSKKEKGILESFIKEDGKTILTELKDEIVIPTIRDLIFNGFKSGLEKLLYGESTPGYYSRPGSSSNRNSVRYNDMYSNYGRNVKQARPSSRYEVDVIEFASMADADAVCENLSELAERYGQVSIADYYRLAGQPFESTDYNYGWYDLRDVRIHTLRGGGFTIEFPKARPLED